MTPERQQVIRETLKRDPRHVVAVDEGFDFDVAIVDDEWVFRWPRRSTVAPALECEITLLPELAPVLPVAVPYFEHVVRELSSASRQIRARL